MNECPQCKHLSTFRADGLCFVRMPDGSRCNHRCPITQDTASPKASNSTAVPDESSVQHEYEPDAYRVCKRCGAQGDVLCAKGQVESESTPLADVEGSQEWHEVAKREPPYGKRILIFSPEYPKGDVMRVRIVTWVTAMTDATHWRELDEPSDTRSLDASKEYVRGLKDAANLIENVQLSVPSQVMADYINALCDKLATDVRALISQHQETK